jgi:5-methylcytosine-specific restriction endonuclease McrBC regulatory subunit McrC
MTIRTTDNITSEKINDDDLKNLHKITGKSLLDIERENPGLLIFPGKWSLGVEDGKNKFLELTEDGRLKTGNIMGFIGIGKTRLIISSRFYPDNNDFFLHYMLSKVCGVNVVNLDFQRGVEESIYDFLPYLFPRLLNDALAQGIYKKYKRYEYNDGHVRGVIDVKRHIRQNIPFTGKVAYTTREYSNDNDVTQLIRHTIERLQTSSEFSYVLTNGVDTKKNVSQIKHVTGTYSKDKLQQVLKANLRFVSHPYFFKYLPLQRLCLQILRGEKTVFGENDEIHGLLFDGAWLWEEYINTVIGDKFLHPGNRTHTLGHSLFMNDNELDIGPTIYPDFISKSAENRLIADAKYKDGSKHNNEDYFQLLAYMYRFNSAKGFLIYPKKSEDAGVSENKCKLSNKVKDSQNIERFKEAFVIKLGLNIPREIDKFDRFKSEMEETNKKLKLTIDE